MLYKTEEKLNITLIKQVILLNIYSQLLCDPSQLQS